ncbi:Uncharacterised protein [Mycobacterium tuberculosis]|nr:Uncharacterised protein [Mycobacterium tuberculosis]
MGPKPNPPMAYMPTTATANKLGLPESISGMTNSDQGRATAHPANRTRRRPSWSQRAEESAVNTMHSSPPSTLSNRMLPREYPSRG